MNSLVHNGNKCKAVFWIFLLAMMLCLSVSQSQVMAADTGIVGTAKATKTPNGTLEHNSKGTRYHLSDGGYAKNKWYYVNGKLYYFSKTGYAPTGWFVYKKNDYYAGSKGIVYVSKWVELKGKRYYLRMNGVKAVNGWVKKNGKYYYFNAEGVLATNRMVTTGGKTYFVGSDGDRKTNCWVTRTNRYYFGKDGVRYQEKWVKYKEKYYYLKKNGAMAKKQWIGDYYVGSDGARMVNCYVDGYYLNALGKKVNTLGYSGKYLFVGDSRTVGMSMSVSSSSVKFIGKVSMGYSWLNSTAGPQVKQYLAGNPKLKVIFVFGINDLGNINSYISYYRGLQREYPEAEIYYLAVNPVNESVASAYGYRVKNAEIRKFNALIKAAFGSKYLNSYSYLTKNGFSSSDGIHYTSETYQKIYQFVLKKIG